MVEKQLKESELLTYLKEMTVVYGRDGYLELAKWDGGGDSGWIETTFDFEKSPEHSEVVFTNMCYESLNYGSWAGSFQSDGVIHFNLEEEQLELSGEEIDYDDTITDRTINHKITIPPMYGVNEIMFMINSNDWSRGNDVDIYIENGIKTEEITKGLENLNEQNKKLVDDTQALLSKEGMDDNEYTFFKEFRFMASDHNNFQKEQSIVVSFDIEVYKVTDINKIISLK